MGEQNFDQFDLELALLEKLTSQPSYQKRIHQVGFHLAKKNRYGDVLPHSDTRVKLQQIGNDSSTDYINASHIRDVLAGCKMQYIATQAPTEASVNDFWRMVWEQNANLVIMLTKETEKDSPKASRYWPESKEAEKFGQLLIALKSTAFEADTVIRIFVMSHMSNPSECRDVTHLQYRGWPDHGVPHEYSSFIKLFEVYRKIRGQSINRPVVTHCSAGIGRTGTFCAIDQILDNLNQKRLSQDSISNPTISIFDVIHTLRQQRPGMVQTKQQYAFCSKFLDHCIQNHLFGI